MKNFLVVGGTSGIGKNIVSKLSEQRHQVWATSRNTPKSDNPNVKFLQYDVEKNNPLTVSSEVIDGLVYCPGTINLKPFKRLSTEDFMSDWELNFLGAVQTIKQVLTQLQRSECASVVLFSTVAVAQGMSYHASIASAKGAIEGLTRSLAAEFAPKIRVNAIAPSVVKTGLAEKLLATPEKIASSASRHPMKRVGAVDDITSMAIFLLTDNSGWLTGQVIGVDGGISSIKMF